MLYAVGPPIKTLSWSLACRDRVGLRAVEQDVKQPYVILALATARLATRSNTPLIIIVCVVSIFELELARANSCEEIVGDKTVDNDCCSIKLSLWGIKRRDGLKAPLRYPMAMYEHN